MGCFVCKSSKRPARFKTNRIEICQWCISLLTSNPIDPEVLKKGIETRIKEYVGRQSICNVVGWGEAEEKARRMISFPTGFNKLTMSLLSSSKMRELNKKLEHYTNKIIQESEEAANIVKKQQIEEIYIQIFQERNGPKVQNFSRKRGFKTWYEEIVSSNQVKYFNALNCGLIAGNEKVSRPGENDWQELRQNILKEDHFKCNICGIYKAEKHIHHIIPISKYGTNNPINLVTLCYKCHDKQHPDFDISKKQ